MSDRGAGFYSGVIPGQTAGTLVGFRIEAMDLAGVPAAGVFPESSGECLVRWGDMNPGGSLAVYRLWMTRANINAWTSREKLSNEPLDGTFVYGGERAIYNAGGRYRGSPFIRPGYSGPTGSRCAYVWVLPEDEPFLGADELNLDSLEPDARDATALREVTSFWMADQLDLPFSYQRYIHVVINGVSNGARGIPVYSDTQQPDSAYMRSWFAEDDRGEIFKIDDWFEFNDSVGMMFNVDATLQNFTTTGGVKKQARYRWCWEKKFNRTLNDDYTGLYALVEALNAPDASYVNVVENMIRVEDWLTAFALRHAVGDWDGYGYDRGKNQFLYKPTGERWRMLLWDLDFSLGCNGGHGPTQSLFSVNDGVIGRLYSNRHFRRQYFQALKRIVDGPMAGPGVQAFLTAKYDALRAAGIMGTTSPFVASGQQNLSIPNWIQQRRNYINSQLTALNAAFVITSNGGNPMTTGENVIDLVGTAPIEVTGIRVNGVLHPVVWTDLTEWSVRVVLPEMENDLVVEGLDRGGQLVAGSTDTIRVSSTAAVDAPESALLINEIQYNPALPQAGFIEIYNRSRTSAFDLTGYRLSGVDFVFAPGTLIGPDGYLVVAGNAAGFVSAYGVGTPLAGIFEGRLDNDGETLRLMRPDLAVPGGEKLVDEVTYDDAAPWPELADGFGPSLQVVDPGQDNNRVGNWAATPGTGGGGVSTLLGMTGVWKYEDSGVNLGTAWREPGYNDSGWSSGAGLLYVENASLPARKNTPLTLGAITFYFRTTFNFTGDPAAVSLWLTTILDDGAVVYLNGTEIYRVGMPAGQPGHTTTAVRTVGDASQEGPFMVPGSGLVSGVNVLAVEVHQTNAGSSDVVWGMMLEALETGLLPATPGGGNSVQDTLTELPALWLNEVQSDNRGGPADQAGEREPWVEILNSGSGQIGLGGYYLSDNPTNLLGWAFPAMASVEAGGYRLVWLDGEVEETTATDLHAGLRLSPLGGSLVLTRVTATHTSVVDYLHYPALNPDRAYGAVPDGTPSGRQGFYTATPGAPNDATWPATTVTINEWMAGNTATVVDPVDGDYDDWFELHNYGPNALDLSGYLLSDDAADPAGWDLPVGTVIEPNGFLLIWADGEVEQGEVDGLHAPFRLDAAGESLGLYAPNQDLVDLVTFGAQVDDQSEGRWPDSGANVQVLARATPGVSNLGDTGTNRVPVLEPIPDLSGPELQLITFRAVATDPDAGQELSFSLVGAVAGAVVNASSGVFTWTPDEAQGPGVTVMTLRVTDSGVPALSAERSFTVTVGEVNQAPQLAALEDVAVEEGVELAFSAAAVDTDLPAQAITYSLDENAPAGAAMDGVTGRFRWTPGESQGPGVYSVTVIATDDGVPPLNRSQTLSITVQEVNVAPVLSGIPNRVVVVGETLELVVGATDTDLPANVLRYALGSGVPGGMVLDEVSGLLQWTAGVADVGMTYPVVVMATDDGSPARSGSTTFEVVVVDAGVPVLEPPVLGADGTLELRWSSEPLVSYRLEWAGGLSSPVWSAVTNLVAEGASTEVRLVVDLEANGFYRVVREE